MKSSLTFERRVRVLTVGLSATLSLYAAFLLLAEPLRTMAAASSSTSNVSVIVAASITNSCTSSVTLGTITGTGDSDSGGFNASHAATCTVSTNNSTGYSLAWVVSTGTGTTGGRTGTGHLNGFRTTANRIRAYTPTVASTPETPSVSTTDARWFGRLSSTSTTTSATAPVSWGADGASDKWLNVATGSTLEIANRTTATTFAGDTQLVGFRVIIGSSKLQATDTYKAAVTFTATTNP